jgi:hypothetical protein
LVGALESSVASATEQLQTIPFSATVSARQAYVRSEPSESALILGTVEVGARLQVIECVPDCGAKGAWALLAGKGAIRLGLLEISGGESTVAPPAEQQFLYATVRAPGAKAYAQPHSGARIVEDLPAHRVMANQPSMASGWVQRMMGSYVRSTDVRLASPSLLQGEFSPELPLAFLIRKGPSSSASGQLPKYSRFAVLEEREHKIRVRDGLVDKAMVRIARRRPRPSGTPERAKWVHVALSQQVMVAHEGDRAVFTTLVSTRAMAACR